MILIVFDFQGIGNVAGEINSLDSNYHGNFLTQTLLIKTNELPEKRAPSCLGYIRDFTTQLCRDYNEPL